MLWVSYTMMLGFFVACLFRVPMLVGMRFTSTIAQQTELIRCCQFFKHGLVTGLSEKPFLLKDLLRNSEQNVHTLQHRFTIAYSIQIHRLSWHHLCFRRLFQDNNCKRKEVSDIFTQPVDALGLVLPWQRPVGSVNCFVRPRHDGH